MKEGIYRRGKYLICFFGWDINSYLVNHPNPQSNQDGPQNKVPPYYIQNVQGYSLGVHSSNLLKIDELKIFVTGNVLAFSYSQLWVWNAQSEGKSVRAKG